MHHFDCTDCRFSTFVAHDPVGAIERLLHGVGRKDPIEDGDSAIRCYCRQAAGIFASDKIKVWGISPNDTTEADDGVCLAEFSQRCSNDRHFPGSRDLDDLQIVCACPGPSKSIEGTREQTVCDEIVESTHHNRDTEALGRARAFAHLDFMGKKRRHMGY